MKYESEDLEFFTFHTPPCWIPLLIIVQNFHVRRMIFVRPSSTRLRSHEDVLGVVENWGRSQICEGKVIATKEIYIILYADSTLTVTGRVDTTYPNN